MGKKYSKNIYQIKDLTKLNNNTNNPIKWAKKSGNLTKEDIQMENKHMRRPLTKYVIRELQIKTRVRYHCTLIRMVKIQNTDNNKHWWGCVATGTLIADGNAKR